MPSLQNVVRTGLRALRAKYSDSGTRKDSGTRRGASEKQRAITITVVDVETPPIISARRRSASTVAKLIIKLLDNQKKSRTKQSRNFALIS